MLSLTITIETLDNGYLLTTNQVLPKKEAFTTTEDLFQELLMLLEGRSEVFTGDLYGKVVIQREDNHGHP